MTESVSDADHTSLVDQLRLQVYAAIAVAGLALIVGYALRQQWVNGLISLVVALLGFSAEQARWAERLSGWAFAGFAILSALSMYTGDSYAWGLIAIASALVAWDLHHLRRRIESVDAVPQGPTLIRRHIRRLLIAVAIGLALAAMALLISVDYEVGVVFIVALVLAIALSQIIGFLRRESD